MYLREGRGEEFAESSKLGLGMEIDSNENDSPKIPATSGF
jgi:hypothetical protein